MLSAHYRVTAARAVTVAFRFVFEAAEMRARRTSWNFPRVPLANRLDWPPIDPSNYAGEFGCC